ncbi:MAG: HlyD family secretion protein, partial [Sulfurimonas sp.]|nr:HlyD family secretion protein [Sulfurimonas sp.]
MKFFFLVALVFSFLDAKVYYAKVEPYEVRSISSNVSGLVVEADETLVGTKLTEKPYIGIDFELDRKELTSVREKIMYLKSVIEINEAVLVNMDESLLKKRENYKKIEPLKVKSSIEKDREFYDLISSENLYLSTRKEIQNLKIQITDLKLRET